MKTQTNKNTDKQVEQLKLSYYNESRTEKITVGRKTQYSHYYVYELTIIQIDSRKEFKVLFISEVTDLRDTCVTGCTAKYTDKLTLKVFYARSPTNCSLNAKHLHNKHFTYNFTTHTQNSQLQISYFASFETTLRTSHRQLPLTNSKSKLNEIVHQAQLSEALQRSVCLLPQRHL